MARVHTPRQRALWCTVFKKKKKTKSLYTNGMCPRKNNNIYRYRATTDFLCTTSQQRTARADDGWTLTAYWGILKVEVTVNGRHLYSYSYTPVPVNAYRRGTIKHTFSARRLSIRLPRLRARTVYTHTHTDAPPSHKQTHTYSLKTPRWWYGT